MPQREVTIINKLGLHARAAAKLVNVASRFPCEIELEKEGQRVNGKSIMGVMMLAASRGSLITLIAEGDEAEASLNEMEALINNRFEEEE